MNKLVSNAAQTFTGNKTIIGALTVSATNSQIKIAGASTDAVLQVSGNTLSLGDWSSGGNKGIKIDISTGACTMGPSGFSGSHQLNGSLQVNTSSDGLMFQSGSYKMYQFSTGSSPSRSLVIASNVTTSNRGFFARVIYSSVNSNDVCQHWEIYCAGTTTTLSTIGSNGGSGHNPSPVITQNDSNATIITFSSQAYVSALVEVFFRSEPTVTWS